jgi:hypothetical protein
LVRNGLKDISGFHSRFLLSGNVIMSSLTFMTIEEIFIYEVNNFEHITDRAFANNAKQIMKCTKKFKVERR